MKVTLPTTPLDDSLTYFKEPHVKKTTKKLNGELRIDLVIYNDWLLLVGFFFGSEYTMSSKYLLMFDASYIYLYRHCHDFWWPPAYTDEII